jgi:hypothetical protein
MDEPGAGFTVSLNSLSMAQSASASLSGQVAQAPEKLLGATPQAIAAHPGWQASQALEACLNAWERRLRTLTGHVQQISQGLNATIGGYSAAEARAIAEIQNAAAGLATPPDARQAAAGARGARGASAR